MMIFIRLGHVQSSELNLFNQALQNKYILGIRHREILMHELDTANNSQQKQLLTLLSMSHNA